MSAVMQSGGGPNQNKRQAKAAQKDKKSNTKKKASDLEEVKEKGDSDIDLNESDYDIFSDHDDKKNIKKRKSKTTSRKLWIQSEDEAIEKLVQKYGTKRWTFIAQKLKEEFKINGRTGKQCRERWHNHLDPDIKKDPISIFEEKSIFETHKKFGNKWAEIAKILPGRSDNCIKNYYYSTLRKHLRRINKSLKQCQVAKRLNIKVKALTADYLYSLVRDKKVTYEQIREVDAKRFQDLEYTMRLIFNHDDDQVTNSLTLGLQQYSQSKLEEIKRKQEEEQQRLYHQQLLEYSKRRSPRLSQKQRKHYDDGENIKMLLQLIKREKAQLLITQSKKRKRTDQLEDGSSVANIDGPGDQIFNEEEGTIQNRKVSDFQNMGSPIARRSIDDIERKQVIELRGDGKRPIKRTPKMESYTQQAEKKDPKIQKRLKKKRLVYDNQEHDLQLIEKQFSSNSANNQQQKTEQVDDGQQLLLSIMKKRHQAMNQERLKQQKQVFMHQQQISQSSQSSQMMQSLHIQKQSSSVSISQQHQDLDIIQKQQSLFFKQDSVMNNFSTLNQLILNEKQSSSNNSIRQQNPMAFRQQHQMNQQGDPIFDNSGAIPIPHNFGFSQYQGLHPNMPQQFGQGFTINQQTQKQPSELNIDFQNSINLQHSQLPMNQMRHQFSVNNNDRLITPSNNYNIHIESTTPQQIIFQFPEQRTIQSPLYLPFNQKSYIFRESPKFQLNFNNSGSMNTHFFGAQGLQNQVENLSGLQPQQQSSVQGQPRQQQQQPQQSSSSFNPQNREQLKKQHHSFIQQNNVPAFSLGSLNNENSPDKNKVDQPPLAPVFSDLKPKLIESSSTFTRKSFQDVMKKKATPLINIETLQPEKLNAPNPNLLQLSPQESSSNLSLFTSTLTPSQIMGLNFSQGMGQQKQTPMGMLFNGTIKINPNLSVSDLKLIGQISQSPMNKNPQQQWLLNNNPKLVSPRPMVKTSDFGAPHSQQANFNMPSAQIKPSPNSGFHQYQKQQMQMFIQQQQQQQLQQQQMQQQQQQLQMQQNYQKPNNEANQQIQSFQDPGDKDQQYLQQEPKRKNLGNSAQEQ